MTKLVRSIKRRYAPKHSTPGSSKRGVGKNQHLNQKSSFKRKRDSLKNKLSPSLRIKRKSQEMFQSNAEPKDLLNGLNNVKKCLTNEIINCLDDDTDTTNDDDDCMLIEPTLENIVIDDDDDDDVPTTSHHAIMINKPHVTMSASLRNAQKLNESPTKSSLFFEYFRTNSLSHVEKPIYFTELPKLRNTGAVTKDEIIVLDESCDMGSQHGETPKRRNANEMDESVIFVSESNKNINFLPLVSNDVPNPIFIQEEPPRQPSTRSLPINKLKHSLFTAKEKKDLNAINCNAYNPAAGNSNVLSMNKKRSVLIDGSNVAFGHSRMKDFSVEGLKICIDYFDKMGHDVKAVVPLFRKNGNKSTNPQLLEELQKLGKVIFTPCKNLPGLVSSSYDDRFIVQLACELDAAIISNDNYRDIIHESTAFKKLIENRVVGYTWCDDIFIIPKDPYGRFGPTLEEILNRL